MAAAYVGDRRGSSFMLDAMLKVFVTRWDWLEGGECCLVCHAVFVSVSAAQ